MVDHCDVGVGRWFVGGRTKSLGVKRELNKIPNKFTLIKGLEVGVEL